jgi:hypothetical protein
MRWNAAAAIVALTVRIRERGRKRHDQTKPFSIILMLSYLGCKDHNTVGKWGKKKYLPTYSEE